MSCGQEPTGWEGEFGLVYAKAAAAYDRGDRNWRGWLEPGEEASLRSMGVTPHDLLDYVEDRPQLDYEDALGIVAVRREYFQKVQRGEAASSRRVTESEIPGRNDQLEGIDWLPRALAKARARLRGELDDALMFSCGGDRGFFRRHGLRPAAFLRAVWEAGEDDSRMAAYVRAGGREPV